jgi:hypothetical protein
MAARSVCRHLKIVARVITVLSAYQPATMRVATLSEKLMHLEAELRISIEDQVLVLGGFGKCLVKLLHDSFTGRVLGRIEVDDLSTAMAYQKQAV